MKTWLFRAALLLVLAAAPTARADLGGWSIANFDTQLQIQAGGRLEVTETITADFSEPRHGIYREIPVLYDVGLHLYNLRFRLLRVENDQGRAWPTKVTHSDNKVRIRIGDADETVTGQQVYRIRYTVDRAILHEGDHAVLRWNATGTEWRVPIGEVHVRVELPRPLNDDQVSYTAWTGVYGAKQQDFRATRPDPSSIAFTTGQLLPGEGISVEVVMPADAVTQAGWLRRLGWWMGDNFPYFLIPTTLAICMGLWHRYGRDPDGQGSIVVQYEPPDDLRPAEVGTLIDERVDLRDLSATIIDLAVRGYLRIEETTVPGVFLESTDYRFRKLKDGTDLRPFEKVLFDKMFDLNDVVLLSDLKEKLYKAVSKSKEYLYRSLNVREYFDGDPEHVRTRSFVIGLLALGVSMGVLAIVQKLMIGRVFPAPLLVSGIVSALIIIVTSWVMPRKTRKGRIALERIQGLEEYIRRAEVDELKTKDRLGVFERLLPYAIAFGLADRWARAFEGLYTQPPEWYGTSTPNFSTAYLASSLNQSVSRMNQVLPSQPRSSGGGGWSSGGFSGGGSSGGGFGGGGGGSW